MWRLPLELVQLINKMQAMLTESAAANATSVPFPILFAYENDHCQEPDNYREPNLEMGKRAERELGHAIWKATDSTNFYRTNKLNCADDEQLFICSPKMGVHLASMLQHEIEERLKKSSLLSLDSNQEYARNMEMSQYR